MFWRIVIGLIVIAVGFLMVWKTDVFLDFIGRIEFADRMFGFEGGSRLFFKLIGCLACFIGMLIATNLIQGTIVSTIGPLFSSVK